MGVVDTSPLCPAEGRRKDVQTSRRARPDRLKRAQARGSTRGYTSWVCTERTRTSTHRMAPPRPAETPPRPAEINTSHEDDAAEKNIEGVHTLLQGFGARPAGPLARPHGIAQQPGGKKVPSAKRQHLRDPTGYPRRCSGATVGDSPRGPLKNRGKPILFRKKQNKTNSQT
jgi:hypothetical protein